MIHEAFGITPHGCAMHGSNRRLSAAKNALEVDRHDLVKRVFADVLELGSGDDDGVVDQTIDTAA